MNIRIFQGGHGLVVYEKNMIAIQRKKEVAAIGNDAFEMYERTPASIVISNPVRDGVIADINNMNKVAETLLKKCGCTTGFMRNNSFYLAVPSDVTEVEKRAYFDLIAHSAYNTHNIFVVEKPLAAALGENVDVKSKKGMMIVDVDLPGFKKDEITIDLKNGYLTIGASKGLDKDQSDQNGKYLRRERYAGVCSRSFYVGENVRPEEIGAKYEDGILRLSVPKADRKELPASTSIFIE